MLKEKIRRALCGAGIGTPTIVPEKTVDGAPDERSPAKPRDQEAAARRALKGIAKGVTFRVSVSASQTGPALEVEWSGAESGGARWRAADLVPSRA